MTTQTANMARTMVYTVDLGDGRVVDVEGPEGATPEQLQQVVSGVGAQPQQETQPDQSNDDVQFGDDPARVQSRFSPEDEAAYLALQKTGSADELAAFNQKRGFTVDRAKLDQFVAARDKGVPTDYQVAYELPVVADQGAGVAALHGAGQGAALGFSDELQGLGAGIGAALSGNDFGDAYNRSVDQSRAELGADNQNHPLASLAGELIGGVAIPAGLERAGLTASIRGVGLAAGRDALRAGATLPEARTIAMRAMTTRIATEGAAYGAVAGAGTSDGDLGDRAAGAVIGGGVGAIGGAALGAIGGSAATRSAAARAAARTPTEAERVGAAAARQGVDVLAADVAGPTTRRLTAAAAQAPISAAPIINQGQRAVEQSAGIRDRVAAAFGNVLTPEAAGERGAEGARTFIRRTSGRGGQLYNAAETASAGVTVTPTRALAVLNRNIRELSDTPGGSAPLERLEALRDAFNTQDFTVQGVRRMRTVLRDEFISEGIRGSDLERRVNQVVDAAAEDVTTSLTAAGRRGAARQFQVADRYWRNRLRTIDDYIAPIIGKNGEASGEQVVQRLQTAAKGNNARLAGFIRALPADEQGDVRATLIGRMGRATKGAQNDQGDAFSLQTFLSNWDEMGESAKATLFGGETRAAMNDLATIASGARQTAGYANRSNTAGGIWGNIGALVGLGSIEPTTAIASLVAQYGGGRLLASPRMARWFARPPANPGGIPAYVARLSRIARAEPAIAADVTALQQRLTDAISAGPARLAAEQRGDDAGVTQGQEREDQPAYEGAQP